MSAVDLARIRRLQERSRVLQPGIVERKELLRRVDDHVQRWLEGLPAAPGYGDDGPAAIAALDAVPIAEEPRSLDEVLDVLGRGVDRVGVNESSGSFFGYIPGSGLYAGALADYHAAVVNRYAGVYYGAPGIAVPGCGPSWWSRPPERPARARSTRSTPSPTSARARRCGSTSTRPTVARSP